MSCCWCMQFDELDCFIFCETLANAQENGAQVVDSGEGASHRSDRCALPFLRLTMNGFWLGKHGVVVVGSHKKCLFVSLPITGVFTNCRLSAKTFSLEEIGVALR